MISLSEILNTAPVAGKMRVVAVYGPTACGKTALAVTLAKSWNGECINADSRQIYRGLNIGTGKATLEEMEGIPHHLMDFKNPDEAIAMGEFVPLARAKIAEISTRGKLPILVGGTGLYLDAILRGFDVPAAAPDMVVREKWEAFVATHGTQALWQELQKRDPAYAARVEPNNVRFVIRALEVIETTGVPKSAAGAAAESPYDVVLVTPYSEISHLETTSNGERVRATAFSARSTKSQEPRQRAEEKTSSKEKDPIRAALYERIDVRTAAMFQNGLLEETKITVEKFGHDAPGLRAIGYAEAAEVLAGTMKLSDAIALAQQRARNYAKRQLTWFRRWPERYPGRCWEGVQQI